jgi:hypothetical protein
LFKKQNLKLFLYIPVDDAEQEQETVCDERHIRAVKWVDKKI